MKKIFVFLFIIFCYPVKADTNYPLTQDPFSFLNSKEIIVIGFPTSIEIPKSHFHYYLNEFSTISTEQIESRYEQYKSKNSGRIMVLKSIKGEFSPGVELEVKSLHYEPDYNYSASPFVYFLDKMDSELSFTKCSLVRIDENEIEKINKDNISVYINNWLKDKSMFCKIYREAE